MARYQLPKPKTKKPPQEKTRVLFGVGGKYTPPTGGGIKGGIEPRGSIPTKTSGVKPKSRAEVSRDVKAIMSKYKSTTKAPAGTAKDWRKYYESKGVDRGLRPPPPGNPKMTTTDFKSLQKKGLMKGYKYNPIQGTSQGYIVKAPIKIKSPTYTRSTTTLKSQTLKDLPPTIAVGSIMGISNFIRQKYKKDIPAATKEKISTDIKKDLRKGKTVVIQDNKQIYKVAVTPKTIPTTKTIKAVPQKIPFKGEDVSKYRIRVTPTVKPVTTTPKIKTPPVKPVTTKPKIITPTVKPVRTAQKIKTVKPVTPTPKIATPPVQKLKPVKTITPVQTKAAKAPTPTPIPTTAPAKTKTAAAVPPTITRPPARGVPLKRPKKKGKKKFLLLAGDKWVKRLQWRQGIVYRTADLSSGRLSSSTRPVAGGVNRGITPRDTLKPIQFSEKKPKKREVRMGVTTAFVQSRKKITFRRSK